MKKIKKPFKLKGRDVTSKLYNAVMNYIHKHGGTSVIIGGVAIVQEDPTKKYSYGIMVRVTGKKPIFTPSNP